MGANEPRDRTPGRIVRDLMRAQPKVAIGTSLAGQDGFPYVSLAIAAVAHDASPLLLLSRLADHTRNLEADPRISLLFDGTAGLASPLTGARASVQGKALRDDDPHLLERFVRQHPDAATYAGFKDFGLFRIEVTRAHLVAGFGRIHWVEPAEILFDTTGHEELASAEARIVAHMNDDHDDAVQLYARMLGADGDGWTLTGIDPEGADLRRRGDTLRVPFERPIRDAADARSALTGLAERARAAAGA
jgi:putative heme iron utilization protein